MEATFSDLRLSQEVVDRLRTLKITVPTPIQAEAIPIALAGKDLIGIAQTGTGKTFAFGLPLLERLRTQGGQALIVLPTRELAEQVQAGLVSVTGRSLKTALIMGGASMGRQIDALRSNPQIIIATPGRLVDHMERRTVNLSRITMLVLDEADRMFDMGFAPQMNKILGAIPTNRQTLLFSATMPEAIKSLAAKYLRSPQTVSVTPTGKTADRIHQELHVVEHNNKPALLQRLLSESTGSVLVFARTKRGTKKLRTVIEHFGEKATELHGNRTQSQRRQALAGFKSGRYRVLVATDVAARGIDVDDITLVINYDLPEQAGDYVHRIGRTARAGKSGRAVSLATPDQHGDVKAIERMIKLEIPLTLHTQFSTAVPRSAPSRNTVRPGRRDGRQQRNMQPSRRPVPAATSRVHHSPLFSEFRSSSQ